MDSGREQNYWPGFVDALSNVVLTLVFVLVIFVFALVMASNKVEQKMKDIEQKTSSESAPGEAQQNAELKKQLAAVTAELEQARASSEQMQAGMKDQQAISTQNEEKQIKVDDKAQDKANEGAVKIDQTSNAVVIGFPLSVAEMDEKSATELGHVLSALEKTIGKHKIIMRSIIGKETYSAAKRLAYYRAVGARNYLITKLGEAPGNITISIVQPPQPEDGRVEILFQKE